ncbi:MAG: ABC transporter permease [Desulfobacula sp.]|nr:ABC transporter permease [Desulfobacula sp.]
MLADQSNKEHIHKQENSPERALNPFEQANEKKPSKAYLKYLRQKKRNRWTVRLSQVLIFVVFLAIWEISARTHAVNPMLTSYPSAIWPTFLELLNSGDMNHQGNIIHHTSVTLLEVAISFVISTLIGIVVGAALWWSAFLYRVLDPYMVIANAMPKIALVPIFYIWLGSTLSIYGIAISIAGFITTLMIYSGFRETEPDKIKLMQVLGAKKWQIFSKLVFPSNLPTITAALKATIGLVLVGVIVGEFQSARAGLGYLIIYGSQVFEMNLVMTAIAILAVMSTVMYGMVLYLEMFIRYKRR